MTRLVDLALGVVLGAAAMTVLVAVAADSPNLDPARISPQHYTVRLENDRVRVLEWRLKPGGREPMHSHPDGVLIVLADSTLKSTSPEAPAITRASVNGEVKWAPAVSHSIENVGSTEAHALLVELKGGSR
jgi:quercetin dioxygenase-like cupin family protein